MDKDSFKLGSKFANKVWNASRFILMNLEKRSLIDDGELRLDETDRWILHRLNLAVQGSRAALDQYRFNDASQSSGQAWWRNAWTL